MEPSDARLYGVPATAFERVGLEGFECTSESIDIPGDEDDFFLYWKGLTELIAYSH